MTLQCQQEKDTAPLGFFEGPGAVKQRGAQYPSTNIEALV